MAIYTGISRSSVLLVTQLSRNGVRLYTTYPEVFLREKYPGVTLRPESNTIGPPKIITMENGLRLAAHETRDPTAKMTLMIGAGSKYENCTNLGVASVARRMAYKSTPLHTQLALGREIERIGGDLIATTSRENIILTVQANRDYIPRLVGLLAEELMCRSTPFLWELKQAQKELEYETTLLAADPLYQAVEGIHQVSFQGTLSLPVIASQNRLNQITPEQVTEFVNDNYTTTNTVLAAVGVDPDQLESLVREAFSLDKAASSMPSASIYKGGQSFILDALTSHDYVILGFNGVSLVSPHRLAAGVLLNILTTNSVSLWSPAPGRLLDGLSKPIASPYHLSAFSTSYHNNGLFGIVGAAPTSDIKTLMCEAKSVLASIKTNGVTTSDVVRGKALYKTSLLQQAEGEGHLEDMVNQMWVNGQFKSPGHIANEIDKITVDDVNEVAKEIFSSKMSLAMVGNPANDIQLDELKL